MHIEDIWNLVTDNPLVSTAIVAALAAVVRYFKPIMGAIQEAFIRRINRAWKDQPEGMDVDERVRKTVERVQSETHLPQMTIERAVRKARSLPPPLTVENAD